MCIFLTRDSEIREQNTHRSMRYLSICFLFTLVLNTDFVATEFVSQCYTQAMKLKDVYKNIEEKEEKKK